MGTGTAMAYAYNYACIQLLQGALCFAVCANCWSALTPRRREVVYVKALDKTVGESRVVLVEASTGAFPMLAITPNTLVRG